MDLLDLSDHLDQEESEEGMDPRDHLDCVALMGHWDLLVSREALASLVRLVFRELLVPRETWVPPGTKAVLAFKGREENRASLVCLGSLARWDPQARTAATEKKEGLDLLGHLDRQVFQVQEVNPD